MTRKLLTCALSGALFCAPSAWANDMIMIADSGSGDRIALFDANDGSLIDINWLTDVGAVGWAFTTPKEAKIVGNEIWVADQVEDAVHRFDLSKNYLSSITTGPGGVPIDNIRSLGTDGSKVYVTNASGGFGNAVITYDTAGNPVSDFSLSGSSFDAEPWRSDEILVSNTSTNALERYDTGGGFLGNFVSGYSFFEQVVVLSDDSVISANAIDSVGVEGIWHFNADGTVRTFLDTNDAGAPGGVPRGANLLNNGDYIVAGSTGVWTAHDTGGGNYQWTLITDEVNGQYVTRFSKIPAPGAVALLGLAGLLGTRRRR